MPNYRRAAISGGTYFFTLVTSRRQKILCHDNFRTALRDAITTTREKMPFAIDAMVLMPDHLHAIWTLPENDHDYSARWSMIKRLVTQRLGGVVGAHGAPYVLPSDGVVGAHGAPYGDGGGDGFVGCAVRTGISHGPRVSASRIKRREGAIWQRRFWEHQVRDQAELNRCLDYLHWNPVKHGIVNKVSDWPYSTFHRFVREGVYAQDWGGQGVDAADADVFGE